jgi:hypothetical protein
MTKATKIKDEFDNILKIIYKAKESYRILHFLWTTSNDEVVDEIKGREFFFAYCKDCFYKDLVIEMSKLFHESDNEQFNLQKFINKIQNDSKFRGVINISILNDWRSEIAGASDQIKKILALRSGYAAHTDRNFRTEDNPLSLKELKEVIDITYYIAKAIFSIIDGSEFFIEKEPLTDSPLASLERILNVLADKKKENLRPIVRLALDNDLESEVPDWYKKELL